MVRVIWVVVKSAIKIFQQGTQIDFIQKYLLNHTVDYDIFERFGQSSNKGGKDRQRQRRQTQMAD